MLVTWKFALAELKSPAEAAVDAFFAMKRRGLENLRFTVREASGKETPVDLAEYWTDPPAMQRARLRAQQETVYYLAAAFEPGLPAVQASPALATREAFNAAYAEGLRRTARGTRFFRIEINPLAVFVHGMGVREPS